MFAVRRHVKHPLKANSPRIDVKGRIAVCIGLPFFDEHGSNAEELLSEFGVVLAPKHGASTGVRVNETEFFGGEFEMTSLVSQVFNAQRKKQEVC